MTTKDAGLVITVHNGTPSPRWVTVDGERHLIPPNGRVDFQAARSARVLSVGVKPRLRKKRSAWSEAELVRRRAEQLHRESFV